MAAALLASALYLCTPAMAGEYSVKVKRGRLTIKADNSPFGSIMNRIGKSAGFEVAISPDIAAKSVTTEFSDIDLERGIQRLMGLISHRNFFMFYGRDGKIKKIEIYGAGKLSSLSGTKPPKSTPPPDGAMIPMIPEATDAGPKTPKQTNADSKPREIENIDGVPYIPPAKMPEYIPPRRGIGSGK